MGGGGSLGARFTHHDYIKIRFIGQVGLHEGSHLGNLLQNVERRGILQLTLLLFRRRSSYDCIVQRTKINVAPKTLFSTVPLYSALFNVMYSKMFDTFCQICVGLSFFLHKHTYNLYISGLLSALFVLLFF